MEKKNIKTNEEEMKYVSPKSKVFKVEIKSSLLDTSDEFEEADEDDGEEKN